MKTVINNSKMWILILSIFTIGCVSCDDPSDPTSINIFSLQDDVNMGKELDAQILADPNEYPILNNPTALAYVQNMVDEIIKSDEVKNKSVFPYNIKIINKDVVNAFAAPGGYLYVYTGLLKFLDNEATIAAVLAHEVAHAERRHASKRMTKQYGVSFLIGLLLGNDAAQWETIASDMLTGLAFLKNSRDDEFEADEYSFNYLKTSMWYPGGITYFFKKIDDNRDAGFLEELLSTHPMPEDRVKAVEDLIKNNNIPAPTEQTIFSQRYLTFKQTLP